MLDCADVTLMGSSGLGALTGAQVAVQQRDGLVAVANVGKNIEDPIIRSKLIDVFKPFDS